MAHVRKDTRVSPPEWWKHLRPYNKRLLAKAERRAARSEITDEMGTGDEPSVKSGLHKDWRKMAELRTTKGESVVPRGIYCYDENGNCPYWDKDESREEQNNGFCWLMMKGDWNDGIDLLWDQCKTCGVRESWSPEGTLPVEDER